MKWKIVTDSGSNLSQGMPTAEGVGFATAPLKITVGDKQFVDDAHLDVAEMMAVMEAYKGPSQSACPSPEDWAKEFREAEYSIAIAITGTLSGSYNSAVIAKKIVQEEFPEKKIHVIDSLTTSGAMRLAAEKANELIASGLSFEEVAKQTESYMRQTKTLFTLSSFDNLIRNGRMGKVTGFVASALKIRAIGIASEKGELSLLHKTRGEAATYAKFVQEMKKQKDPATWEKVIITHNFNELGAEAIKSLIAVEYPGTVVVITPTEGLNSFYAERSGILVGF